MAEQYLCNKTDVQPGQLHRVEIGDEVIVVYQLEGRYYAANARCPHKNFFIAGAISGQCQIQCPHHHWIFDAYTGHTVRPITPHGLKIYDVIETDDEISICLDV